YLSESAQIAEALGAEGVPKSLAHLQAYLRAIQPKLVFDDRTREVLRVLEGVRLPIPLAGASRGLFLGAAATLLPDWALDMMGRSAFERARDRVATGSLKLLAPSIRDAMAEGGLAWRACVRVGADYGALFRWP